MIEGLIAMEQSSEFPSVGAMLRWRVATTPASEAFRYRDAQDNWVSIDWSQARRRVDVLAAGLLALGLESEQRVTIVASTRIEWVLTDLAINCAGGATTTIYPNTAGDDFDHIISDSGSVIVVAENAEQKAKLDAAAEAAAKVHTVILMDGNGDGENVLSWSQFVALGEQKLAAEPDVVDTAIAATAADQLAT